MENYLKERENLKGTVLLVDSRRGPLDPDMQLVQWLDHYGKRKLIVLTKIDKLSRSELSESTGNTREILELEPDSLVLFSAKTGQGKDKILSWIREITTH